MVKREKEVQKKPLEKTLENGDKKISARAELMVLDGGEINCPISLKYFKL